MSTCECSSLLFQWSEYAQKTCLSGAMHLPIKPATFEISIQRHRDGGFTNHSYHPASTGTSLTIEPQALRNNVTTLSHCFGVVGVSVERAGFNPLPFLRGFIVSYFPGRKTILSGAESSFISMFACWYPCASTRICAGRVSYVILKDEVPFESVKATTGGEPELSMLTFAPLIGVSVIASTI